MRTLVFPPIFILMAACGSATGGTSAMTCDTVVPHVVGLLAHQGDDAILKSSDIPRLTAGCDKAGNLKTDANAACIAAAADIDAAEACGKKAFDKLVMPWMKG
jgi:hypothetical protein